MGNEQNNANAEMEKVSVGAAQRKVLQRSTNKPSPTYAKFAEQKPVTPPIVSNIKANFQKKLQFNKTKQPAEELPMFEMIKTGIFYKGHWYQGKQHGEGQIFTKNGVYFHGQFNNGVAECKDGLLIFPDGSYYRGSFKENNFNGKGTLKHVEYNGSSVSEQKFSYEGNWQQNKPHGFGVQIYQDKSKYEGNFVAGKKHGQGTFTWANGKSYKGEFVDGHMHGHGQIRSGKGVYAGTFEKGLKTGGANTTTEFGTYAGKYRNGLMHDEKARFTWNDGKVYQGGFQFGQMHGFGKIIFPNKQVVSGRWQNGQNINIDKIQGSGDSHH